MSDPYDCRMGTFLRQEAVVVGFVGGWYVSDRLLRRGVAVLVFLSLWVVLLFIDVLVILLIRWSDGDVDGSNFVAYDAFISNRTHGIAKFTLPLAKFGVVGTVLLSLFLGC